MYNPWIEALVLMALFHLLFLASLRSMSFDLRYAAAIGFIHSRRIPSEDFAICQQTK